MVGVAFDIGVKAVSASDRREDLLGDSPSFSIDVEDNWFYGMVEIICDSENRIDEDSYGLGV